MSEQKFVKFVRPAPPYYPPDVAVFDTARAQRLVDSHAAVFCDKNGSEIKPTLPAEQKPADEKPDGKKADTKKPA